MLRLIVRRPAPLLALVAWVAFACWALAAWQPSTAQAQFPRIGGSGCSLVPVTPASPVGCQGLVPLCLCRGQLDCEWVFACQR